MWPRLRACKLPIISAEPQIQPGAKENEPDYAFAKEIAAFVRDNLFGGLKYQNTLGMRFSPAMGRRHRKRILCLDYGCSGYEDIWAVDGNHVRVSRLAPRLATTFYRFHVEVDGETLKSVEQWGYRGMNFVNVAMPANKFVLFSLRKEGANFYGISLLRAAYQHWYVKSALYRIDSIACERNRTESRIVEGPSTGFEDKDKALAWLEQLTAKQKPASHYRTGET